MYLSFCPQTWLRSKYLCLGHLKRDESLKIWKDRLAKKYGDDSSNETITNSSYGGSTQIACDDSEAQ